MLCEDSFFLLCSETEVLEVSGLIIFFKGCKAYPGADISGRRAGDTFSRKYCMPRSKSYNVPHPGRTEKYLVKYMEENNLKSLL